MSTAPACLRVEHLGLVARPAQPGVLDGVLRLVELAEHPVREPGQPRAVRLEARRGGVGLRRAGHALVGIRGWVCTRSAFTTIASLTRAAARPVSRR